VLDLVDQGVSDFHFYTMNRADLVYAVCHLLGLRPSQPAEVPHLPLKGGARPAEGRSGGGDLSVKSAPSASPHPAAFGGDPPPPGEGKARVGSVDV